MTSQAVAFRTMNLRVSLQVIVVNYEDKHTTMEAPDDQDEISYK